MGENDSMDFSTALGLIKSGVRMSRIGWNGRGMFVFLVPGSKFEVNRPPLLGIYQPGTVVEYRPHIDMVAADGTVGVWVPSQTDILADDWQTYAGN
jgi:hypothetical protein